MSPEDFDPFDPSNFIDKEQRSEPPSEPPPPAINGEADHLPLEAEPPNYDDAIALPDEPLSNGERAKFKASSGAQNNSLAEASRHLKKPLTSSINKSRNTTFASFSATKRQTHLSPSTLLTLKARKSL